MRFIVITLLDVPLLNSTDDTLSDKLKNFSTLKSEGIDKDRDLKKFESPVFKNFVISENGQTSGIIVYIKEDKIINTTKDKKLEDYKNNKKEGIIKNFRNP